MGAPVLLDATPLADGHSARGIGTALRGVITALGERSANERPALLVRRGQPLPDGYACREVAWPRWPLEHGSIASAPRPWTRPAP